MPLPSNAKCWIVDRELSLDGWNCVLFSSSYFSYSFPSSVSLLYIFHLPFLPSNSCQPIVMYVYGLILHHQAITGGTRERSHNSSLLDVIQSTKYRRPPFTLYSLCLMWVAVIGIRARMSDGQAELSERCRLKGARMMEGESVERQTRRKKNGVKEEVGGWRLDEGGKIQATEEKYTMGKERVGGWRLGEGGKHEVAKETETMGNERVDGWILCEVGENQTGKEKETLNLRRNVKEERWTNVTRKQEKGG